MQETKKKGNLNDLANYKHLMSLNESLLEATKVAIKGKNNDMVIQMMENYRERPQLWYEYLTVAILYQNFTITKHFVEKLSIDVSKCPEINASIISNEILQDQQGKSDKSLENKESYLKVDCPWIIQAAVGGDIDIFNYLLDHGANVNSVGHITLSRKNKNSVISNVLGAAAYYGRSNLVHFILEKYPAVDKNYKCTEKKAKVKQFNQSKEFADFTPVHLCISSEIQEDDTIEILRKLNTYGSKFDLTDFNKNNILHLATKLNKFAVVKYIVDDLKLINFANELNKEGQTPVAVDDLNSQIKNYLQQYLTTNDNYEEILELFENSKNKNQRKGKKKKNQKDEFLINSSEFHETLKIPLSKPKIEAPREDPKSIVPISTTLTSTADTPIVTKNIKEDSSSAEHENDEEQNLTEDNKQHYERRSYYNDKNYRTSGGNYYRNNYDNNYKGNYNKGYDNNYKKDNYGYGNKYYNKDYNSQGYAKKIEQPVIREIEKSSLNANPSNNETSSNTFLIASENQNSINSIPISTKNNLSIDSATISRPKSEIIGLHKNKKTKHEKIEKNIVKLEENSILSEGKAEDKEIKLQFTMESAPIILKNTEENKIEDHEGLIKEKEKKANSDTETNKIEEQLIEKVNLDIQSSILNEDNIGNIEQTHGEKLNIVTIELNKITETIEEEHSKLVAETKKEVHVEVQVQPQSEISAKPQTQSQPAHTQNSVQQNIISTLPIEQTLNFNYSSNTDNLKEITAKYLNLERSLEKEKNAKVLMERYLFDSASNKQSSCIVQLNSNEENILDLLYLSNQELEKKSKLIAELQSKIQYLEGTNIESMSESQLNQLKDFYGSKLSSIVSKISNFNNFK